jgi:hypothetical protein
MWTTYWANFCQLLLKLGHNDEISNWATFYAADFLGRKYFYRTIFESCGPEFGHLTTVVRAAAYHARTFKGIL